MNKFTFHTDEKFEKLCNAIALRMVELFGISEQEAIGRINRQWSHIIYTGPDSVLYHETADYYAKLIYYPAGTFWWKGEKGLNPKPYP